VQLVEQLTRTHGLASPLEAAELRSVSESMAPDAAPRFLSEEDLARGTETLTSDPRTREQLDDLENYRGVGWLDDVTEPVSASTVNQLVCDSGFQRLVLGPGGEVLELGTTERLFDRAQRRALAVRDGGWVWPGCNAPPSWCEAHHFVEWVKGGLTDVDNGVLLCSADHHMLHASDFRRLAWRTVA
jgi:hypothetical protein